MEIAETVDLPPPATAYIQDLVAGLHGAHANALANCAKPDQAMRSMRAMRKRLSEIDHDYSKAGALATMSIAWYLADDPETARSTADEALAIANERGFHTAESMAWIIRGWARACLGDPDEGVSDVERGLALAETSGSDVVTQTFYVASAHVHRMAKNRKRAEGLLNRAKTLDERDGTTQRIVDITFADALIRLEFGDGLPEVENLLLQAVGDADSFETGWTGLRISTQLARIAPQTGKVREAHDRLANHYARLTEGFDRTPAREAKAMLEELAGMLEAETAAP